MMGTWLRAPGSHVQCPFFYLLKREAGLPSYTSTQTRGCYSEGSGSENTAVSCKDRYYRDVHRWHFQV